MQLCELFSDPIANADGAASEGLASAAHRLVAVLERLDGMDARAAALARRACIDGRTTALLEADLRTAVTGVRATIHGAVAGIKQVDQYIDQLGNEIGTTAPIQHGDERIHELESAVAHKFPKLSAVAKNYGEWAKRHPVLQSFIILTLTIIGGLAGGPAGSAAAAAIFRAATTLMQGGRSSAAIGKAVKDGLIGYIIGSSGKKLARMLGQVIVRGVSPELASVTQPLAVDASGRPTLVAQFFGTPKKVILARRLLTQAQSSIESKGWNKAARLFSALGEMDSDEAASSINDGQQWKTVMSDLASGFASRANEESDT